MLKLNRSFWGPFYLSLAATIWGGMYVVSKFALETIPPITLLFIRYLLASCILGMLCYVQRIPLYFKEHRGTLIQIGVIGYFISVGAQFIGTKLSSAHMGSLITTLSPIFLSLFAIMILKERMTKKQVVAMILAIIGLIIIIGLPKQGDGEIFLGNLILLIAALSWGYYSVMARKASSTYSPLQITTFGIWIATVLTFPFIFIELHAWTYKSLFEWPIITSSLYLGVISTAVAFFSWNKGLQLTPSHQAGLFFFLQPVVGSLLGWLLLHEELTYTFFIGSLLIFVGVYISLLPTRVLHK